MYPDPNTVRTFEYRLPRSDQRPSPRASEIRLRVRRLTRHGA